MRFLSGVQDGCLILEADNLRERLPNKARNGDSEEDDVLSPKMGAAQSFEG